LSNLKEEIAKDFKTEIDKGHTQSKQDDKNIQDQAKEITQLKNTNSDLEVKKEKFEEKVKQLTKKNIDWLTPILHFQKRFIFIILNFLTPNGLSIVVVIRLTLFVIFSCVIFKLVKVTSYVTS